MEILENLPGEIYHDRPELSASKINDFCRSPAFYHALHLSPNKAFARSTTSQEEGTIAHICLFQPDLFLKRYVRVELPRRGTAEWRATEAANPGRTLLKVHEYDEFMRMAEVLRTHPLVSRLFAEGKAEQSAFYEMLGRKMKSRFDWVSQSVIVDLKKTSSIESFASSAVRYGYHRQAWLYSEAHKLMFGNDGYVPFYFLAFELKYPYPIRIFQASDEFLEAGKKEVISAIDGINECEKSGIWPDNSGPYILDVPVWYGSE